MEYIYDHVLIETNFSFLNAIWNGNTAFIKINDHYYWMDQHNWMEEDQISEKKNLCKDQDVLSEKWTTPIRIVYRKNQSDKENDIKITFGFKFNPFNNLSQMEFSKCSVSDLQPLKEIVSFSEMYVSIK